MNKYFDLLYKDSFNNFIKKIEQNLLKEKKTFIITANPETFMFSERDEELEKIILDKDVTMVADGIGLVKAAKIVNKPVKERITGIDIATELLDIANKNNLSLYLFGSAREVINSMEKVIKEKYPNIELLGTCDGYVKDKDKVFDKIVKLSPDIVMVALGIPAQEKLIYKHYNKFEKGVFIGVGGSFDVISGHKKRAPKIFIKLNLEWLYRILKEPKRIKRFYNSNVKFLVNIKKLNKGGKI